MATTKTIADSSKIEEKVLATETPVTYGDAADSSADATADTSIAMGDAQAKQYIPTTVINNGKVPQVDTASYKERARHLTNGDIRTEDGATSVLASKMVNEAHAFQPSKAVVNSFPATGSAYLKTLDFKISGSETEK